MFHMISNLAGRVGGSSFDYYRLRKFLPPGYGQYLRVDRRRPREPSVWCCAKTHSALFKFIRNRPLPLGSFSDIWLK